MILDMQEMPSEVATAITRLGGNVTGLLSEANLLELADDMKSNPTVAVFLCEHIWATAIAQAARGAGGTLMLAESIPGDVVDAARASMHAA